MKIHVSTKDFTRLKKHLNTISAVKVPRAAQRALNRAAKSTQTAILREESKRLKITQKRLRRRVRFQRRDEARLDKLRSQVYLVISDVPVTYLGASRQTKKGAKVRGKLYEGKFRATMPSGHLGVYGRLGKERFPIEEEKTEVRIEMKDISEEMVERIGVQVFRERFGHELAREFK